jgi:ABC-2 type transport system ATP-binding protein
MDTPAIELQGLGKTYRSKTGEDVVAVEDLSLSVRPGEIFGLLGPNGAGKTTTVRMVCGLLEPSHGQARVEGSSVSAEPDRVRRLLGIVPSEVGHHELLTVSQELEYFGALYGLDPAAVRSRAGPLLERLGLTDRKDDLLKTFSTGMRRKVHLIRALLHEPRILLLDEPTAGLDPVVTEEVWELLKNLTTDSGVTVILCSHHLEEVERLCDRVAIIRRQLLAQGTLAELSTGGRAYEVQLTGPASEVVSALDDVAGLSELTAEGDGLSFRVTGAPREVVPQAVERLVQAGAGILSLHGTESDLRTLYRRIVVSAEQATAEGAA